MAASTCTAAYYWLGPGQLLGADAPTAWGRFLNDNRFAPAFFVDGEGDLVLELRKVGELAS
jgi:hypothetical protein